jgi:hypothetical protein
MTATDLGLVVVVVASIASVAAVLAATVALVRSARALRVTMAVVERDLEAARSAVASADAGARRAEEVVINVEELAGELETSSRLIRRLLVGPVVRVAAVVRGTGRALGGLFGGRRRRRQRRADSRQRNNNVPPVATGVHSRRSSTT